MSSVNIWHFEKSLPRHGSALASRSSGTIFFTGYAWQNNITTSLRYGQDICVSLVAAL
jgi:hypothetical protein